jgi:hypothetical protein
VANRFQAKWFPILVCVFLCGCTSSRPTYSSLQSKLPPVSTGKSRIFFYSRQGSEGGQLLSGGLLSPPEILIDGQLVGEASRGVFFADVAPGQHTMSCRKCADPSNVHVGFFLLGQVVSVSVVAGESRYVDIEYLPGGPRILLVDADQANQEIADLPYIGH